MVIIVKVVIKIFIFSIIFFLSCENMDYKSRKDLEDEINRNTTTVSNISYTTTSINSLPDNTTTTTVSNNSINLPLNSWITGDINYDSIWYYINGIKDVSYKISWDDFFNGTTTYSGDIKVSAFKTDKIASYFTLQDNGYTTPQIITAESSNYIYIKVEVVANKIGNFGINIISDILSVAPEALDCSDYIFTNNFDKEWQKVTNESFYNSDSLKSPFLTDSQNASFKTKFTGTSIRFYWKVSSEFNYDYLIFYIDDVEESKISGDINWEQKIFIVSNGEHTAKWKYIKDNGGSQGSDCAWVDYIIIN